jgi:hypothetical protein
MNAFMIFLSPLSLSQNKKDDDPRLASRGRQCAQLFETVETGADLFRKTIGVPSNVSGLDLCETAINK